MPSPFAALASPFLEPGSRTFWAGLLSFALVALAVHRWRGGRGWMAAFLPVGAWKHPSHLLDLQLFAGRQLLGVWIGAQTLGAWWLATRWAMGLDHTFGTPTVGLPGWLASVLYALTLFVVWDLSRFVVHLVMHKVPFLWAFHQVHHSAEVLTPLTFHRVHPVEAFVYQLRGMVVTAGLGAVFFWLFRGAAADFTVLGVSGLGFTMNLVHGNLRHSHVWVGFGPIESWFISPAQHQLHHSVDPAHHDSNYGTWLAIWDRMLGTLRRSEEGPPAAFGLPADARNHGNDLVSAWFGPVVAAVRGPWLALPLLLGVAQAQEPAEPDEPTVKDSRDPEEILIYGEDGLPRVAGSAHKLEEEELERFELDDIHSVLEVVPGIYTREEDGFGLRPNIGLRGANSDRSAKVTLMEDGVLFGPAPYAAPAAYYFPMVTRMVGVEVFKGPAAISHGPQTIGGAINLVTRPIPDEAAGAFDVAAGLRNSMKLHGWTGTSGPKTGILLEMVRVASGGFKELPDDADTGFDRRELMLKTRVGNDPAMTLDNRLELKLGYASERSNETYLGLTEADFARNPNRRYAGSALDQMLWGRTQAELAWTLDHEDVQLRTVAYHHHLDRAWTKFNRFSGGPDAHALLLQPDSGQSAVYLAILRGQEDTISPDQQLMIGTNDRRFHAGGVQSRLRWDRPVTQERRIGSALEAGVRVHADDVKRLHTEDPHDMFAGALQAADADRLVLLDSHARALAGAAYVLETVDIHHLHVIPGLRVEAIRSALDEEGAPSAPALTRVAGLPGLGALYEVAHGFDVFGGVHRGFGPVPPGQPKAVRPELAWNYELGVRGGGGGAASGELVGFFNDYQNLTGECTISGGCSDDDIGDQFNGGEVDVWGLESLGKTEKLLRRGFSVPMSVTYTFTRSSFRTDFSSGFPQFGEVEAGDGLPYVPEHQGAVTAGLAHDRGALLVSAAGRTGMDDTAGGYADLGLSDPFISPTWGLDLAGHFNVSRHVELYASGTNVTNVRNPVSWRPFGARPNAPAQVMVGLKVHSPDD